MSVKALEVNLKPSPVVQLVNASCPGPTIARACPLLVPPQKGQRVIYAPVFWLRWEAFALWGTWPIKTWNMKIKFCSWIDLQGWADIMAPTGESLDKYFVFGSICRGVYDFVWGGKGTAKRSQRCPLLYSSQLVSTSSLGQIRRVECWQGKWKVDTLHAKFE